MKNRRMIIVVSSLVLVIGVSFAYFMASILLGGSGSSTTGTTATLNNSEIRVEGTLEFNDLDIYPGHQTISSIKVTATGNNELVPYNLIWQGTNTINTPLNYTVYKTSSEVEVNISCNKTRGVVDGAYRYYEECSESNIDALGTEVSSGTINANETKVELVSDEFVTATNDGLTMYYYVVLEYPNLEESQNIDIGGTFTGEVTVELSDTEPDINIIAAYIEQEDGSYKQVEDIPQSGYILNTEKSTCSNGAIPGWDVNNARLYVDDLTKSGTSCYLYFDGGLLAKDTILSNFDTVLTRETFDYVVTSTTSGTIYKSLNETQYDNDGEVYYFAGNPIDNWVSFAGYYWRIIRINGNGSIRLIYNGKSAETSGVSTQISLDGGITTSYVFNSNYWTSDFSGLKYSEGEQHGTRLSSDILRTLNTWYEQNLINYSDDLDINSGFCNDRNLVSGYSWTNSGNHYYAAYARLITNKTATLKCDNLDLFTHISANNGNKSLIYPLAIISADEAVFAGGVMQNTNHEYYLYTGQTYWTMSPYCHLTSGSLGGVQMIRVYSGSGSFDANHLHNSAGIRPVINLRADVELSGTGTASDPYVVVN